MSVFSNYAQYYDLLYKDKNYAEEAKFICNLIQNKAPNTKKILELGCGTGIHAALLAKEGFEVHGVDISFEMLQLANNRISQLSLELAEKLQFSHGDIRKVRLNTKFDVVLSLFHVISYQTTNADILAAFETAKTHLKPGGIFIFDIWYGPTVLSELPSVRIKRLEDDQIKVIRIAEPIINTSENTVDVIYKVFIQNKHNDSFDELQETHKMRYLFKPEIENLLNSLNLSVIEYGEWLTKRKLSTNTWGVYFIGQL